MLVVTIDLHSARTGKKKNLGTIIIANDGTGTDTKGNYWGRAYRAGMNLSEWSRKRPIRQTEVKGHPRMKFAVWHLVTEVLINLGYEPKGMDKPKESG